MTKDRQKLWLVTICLNQIRQTQYRGLLYAYAQAMVPGKLCKGHNGFS